MKFKKILGNLLIMTKAERNGSLLLIALLILLIIIKIAIPSFKKKDQSYIEKIEKKIAILEYQKDSIALIADKLDSFSKTDQKPIKRKYTQNKSFSISEIEYFEFDPNTINYNELLLLGLPENTAATFLKFRSTGAIFYKPDDLLKIYGIDSMMFVKLKPFIVIEPHENEEIQFEKHKSSTPANFIDINSADSTQWTTLPGIGPVFAGRICKFRNYLGGFVNIEQLKEVYNFPEETYSDIYEYLKLDSFNIKQINLNFATIEDLKKHPYCNYATARKIVDFRSDHGVFSSVNQLLNDSIIAFDHFEKLSPYLKVSN